MQNLIHHAGGKVEAGKVLMVSALRSKRAELAGMVSQLEQQLVRQRTNLSHLDATMQLFDPDIGLKRAFHKAIGLT
jgi:hypothetical protein